MHREGIFDKHRQDVLSMVTAAVGGQPVAQGWVGPVPQGYAWYVENVAFAVVGNSHTAVFDVAITTDDTAFPAATIWDHAGLVASIPAAVQGSTPPGLAFYAGPGHHVHAYAIPGTLANGDVVVATFQIAVHQLDPTLGIMSPEDRRALQAFAPHDPGTTEVAEVATAGRRAY